MLLLGIAACIWLTGRRWVSWGGDWDLVFRVALWGVIAGVDRRAPLPRHHELEPGSGDPRALVRLRRRLGRRARHLGRDPVRRPRRRVVVHRSGNSVPLMMDAVAPGLLLAQGDRPLGQLLEPGAVRQADQPAVGAADRSGAPERDPRAYHRRATFRSTTRRSSTSSSGT